jgi:UDP-N-acetylglucosamine--N-acetylmuramyl-(pentapeptide) pyrophosphoryl-undecaprenol N-acetylglucosamine transferase
MRIVLTGGGTGGHVVPFAPLIEAVRLRYGQHKDALPPAIEPSRLDLFFFGPVDETAAAFFAQYDIPTTHIPSGKLRRYFSLLTVRDLLWRLPVGFLKALIALWWVMPDAVMSKGGYGSLPVVAAAIFYRIPILLHESDVVMGMANQWTARFSTAIAVSYQPTIERLPAYKEKIFLTGTPVRSTFTTLARAEALQFFELPEEEPVLLVMGGSQGAQQLNETLLQCLPSLIVDMAIIHLTGTTHFTAVQAVAQELIAQSPRKHLYKAYPYLTDGMAAAMTAATIVVSRAGATTLAELAAAGRAALLVPLDSAAHDHQRYNAAFFEGSGAARVLDPSNLTHALLEHNLRLLLKDEQLRGSLSANIHQLFFPHAGQVLADLLFKLASGLAPAV